MKISFGNYSYYDPTKKSAIPQGVNTKGYRFNNKLFQQLIASGQYKDAADYAAKYHFNDPAIQRAHENDILNLRREGRKLTAIYSQVSDEDTKQKMKFMDNVFVNGGLDRLSKNPYAKEFGFFKQHLGSAHKKGLIGYTNEIDKEATAISFTFAPEKQKLFGIDWLAKDNTKHSVEAFYANSGLNEAALKSAGVEITHKDGYTTIKFDKSNPLANKIIYNAIPPTRIQGDLFRGTNYDIELKGYTADGKEIQDISYLSQGSWDKMRDMIADAKEAKTKAFSSLNMGEKDYSSTIGPYLDDNLEQLNQLAATGQITEQEYNQQKKLIGSVMDQAIRSLGTGEYEMYSNAYNDEATDETLVPLDNKQRSEIIQSIGAADPKKVHFNAMISNGKLGTLVTVDADEVDNKDITDDDDRNQVKRRARHVFIPGLMSDLAQEKINRNTSTRAVQEINSMQDYGYSFKTTDGQKIYSSMDGRFWCDGQEITKDDAIKSINKTMIIEDETANLKYQFTNKEGTMYDTNGYENMARVKAIRAANELYPEISFGDKVTVQDVFNKKGAGATVADKYASTMQYQLYDKYQTVFDIYDKIMAAIINND